MTPVKERTAEEEVQRCLDEIRRARLAGGDAVAAKARAADDIKTAENDRQEAAEAKARGEDGAEQQFDDASGRLLDALSRQERAQLEDEAAQRVIRSAEARLHQTRLTHFDELAEVAEEAVVAVGEAAEALGGPLIAYVTAYERASAAWRQLGPASQQRVLELDSAVGRYRDHRAVMADASLPACPIPPNAVALVRAVMLGRGFWPLITHQLTTV